MKDIEFTTTFTSEIKDTFKGDFTISFSGQVDTTTSLQQLNEKTDTLCRILRAIIIKQWDTEIGNNTTSPDGEVNGTTQKTSNN